MLKLTRSFARSAVLAVVPVIALVSVSAEASPVEINAEGTFPAGTGAPDAGKSYVGVAIFDSSTAPSGIGGCVVCTFDNTFNLTGTFSLEITGSTVFSATSYTGRVLRENPALVQQPEIIFELDANNGVEALEFRFTSDAIDEFGTTGALPTTFDLTSLASQFTTVLFQQPIPASSQDLAQGPDVSLSFGPLANNAVSEPSSIALFATALFGLSWLARRKPS